MSEEQSKPRKRAFVAAPQGAAHNPAPISAEDIHAIRALAQGKASEDQQRRFVEWFVQTTGFKRSSYVRGGDDGRRDTDFALGAKFVAEQFFSIAVALPPRQ